MATRRLRTGTVSSFDDPIGLGEVREDSGERFGFHCTAIADGTRTIEVGTEVRFAVLAGHVGRDEAFDLTPLGTRTG